MRRLKTNILLLSLVIYSSYSQTLHAELALESTPLPLILKSATVQEDRDWDSSKELKPGLVHIIFYVAPPAKSMNDKATEHLKAKGYKTEQVKSWAVVNMADSSWPNFLIRSEIKKSQAKHPHTTYLKDYDYTMLKTWQFAHKSNDILVLDPDGKVLFAHNGAMDEPKIESLIDSIDKAIAKNKKEEPTENSLQAKATDQTGSLGNKEQQTKKPEQASKK